MNVPTRSDFVMTVVTPAERAAAASFTAVPRSLPAAASPAIGGALFSVGWLAAALVACGVFKMPTTSRSGTPSGGMGRRRREAAPRRPRS